MQRALILVVILGIIGAGVYFWKTQMQTPSETSLIEETSMQDDDSQTLKESTMNPDLSVDENGLSKATVVIDTAKGPIKFKFYSEDAPNTVDRIVTLINEGFYNGLNFHRVVPGFVVQGGDPEGNGTGGSGENLKAEFNKRKHVEGTVAMARAQDPDSADSQFYISLGVHPHLDNNYTVFGQVIEGMPVVQKLEQGDVMEKVTIE